LKNVCSVHLLTYWLDYFLYWCSLYMLNINHSLDEFLENIFCQICRLSLLSDNCFFCCAKTF
jgi:hypothetical protein